MTVFAETIVRLLPHLSALAIGPILIGKTVGNVVAELSVQHLVTLGVALVVLKLRAWYPHRPRDTGDKDKVQRDGRQENFT